MFSSVFPDPKTFRGLFSSGCHPGLLGDALVEKIVEMHESCAEIRDGGVETTAGAGAAPAAGGVGGRDGEAAGKTSSAAATPKEYMSFLRSWFEMNESKKVNERWSRTTFFAVLTRNGSELSPRIVCLRGFGSG